MLQTYSGISSGINQYEPHSYRQLGLLLDFIYIGEVNVMQEDIEAFLAAAMDLKIQGLTPSSPQHQTEDLGFSSDLNHSSEVQQYPTTPIQITPDRHAIPCQTPLASVSDLLSPYSSPGSGPKLEDRVEDKLGAVKEEPADIPDENQEGETPWQPTEYSDLKRFVTRLANDKDEGHVYSCKLCHQKGSRSENVQAHVESAHFPDTFKHVCNFCEKACGSKHALRYHIKEHKADRAHLKYVKQNYKVEKVQDFEKGGDLTREGKVKSWSDLKQYVTKQHDPDEKKPFQCTICQFKGRQSYDMQIHVEKYHFYGALKHFCNLCDALLDTKSALKCHMKSRHTQSKQV